MRVDEFKTKLNQLCDLDYKRGQHDVDCMAFSDTDSKQRNDLHEELLRAFHAQWQALTLAKPIVGAAVASPDNKGRPLRQGVYNRIVEALK